MLRHAFSSLLARKLRLALTGLAIVLGVGLVSATLLIIDTSFAALDRLYPADASGVDAVVRPAQAVDDPPAAPAGVVPAAVVNTIAGLEGVSEATGIVTGFAQLVGRDGVALGGKVGEPPRGRSVDRSVADDLAAGRLPDGPGQVVIDRASADSQDYGVGARVRVAAAGAPARPYMVVGIVDRPELRGEPFVGLNLGEARALFQRPDGEFDAVHVQAVEGVDQDALRERVAAAVGDGFEVATGASEASALADRQREDAAFLLGTLAVFALLAVVVGSFTIRTTFTIVLAQRTRELALWRALGASRRQVQRSVLVEATAVGAVASAVGIAVGIGMAVVLRSMLGDWDALQGLDLSPLRLTPRALAAAGAVGVLVTVWSARAPARRAGRVAPVEALRDEQPELDRPASRRPILAGTLALAAAALLVATAVTGGSSSGSVALAALLALVGVDALGPVVARPVAALVGWPVARGFGTPGELARHNTARTPRRTAAMATGLMIGLALVTFLAVWVASTKTTRHAEFDRNFTADYRLNVPGTRFAGPIDQDIAERLAALPELDTVAAFLTAPDRSSGHTGRLPAGDA